MLVERQLLSLLVSIGRQYKFSTRERHQRRGGGEPAAHVDGPLRVHAGEHGVQDTRDQRGAGIPGGALLPTLLTIPLQFSVKHLFFFVSLFFF